MNIIIDVVALDRDGRAGGVTWFTTELINGLAAHNNIRIIALCTHKNLEFLKEHLSKNVVFECIDNECKRNLITHRLAKKIENNIYVNKLAKKYHPDANMKDGIDTTKKMQRILEAYRILSDPKKRASYDRKVFGKPSSDSDRNFDLFNLHNNIEETDPVIGTPFVNYWRAADSLYDITLESEQLFKDKNKENTRSARLSDLAAQALSYAVTLREAEIPEKYWLPAIMDWLLFTWYKNRNLPVSYLLKLYDEYSKKELNGFKRVKIQKEQLHFQHSLKRLVNYG